MNQKHSSNRLGHNLIPDILGVKIHPCEYNSVSESVCNWADAKNSASIFATNVHVVMESQDDPEFFQILNSSDINTPDGMPLVWMLRLKGYPQQQRVYGPTLMLHILEMASREGIPVGFYGGKVEVLELLGEKMGQLFPDLKIVYAWSPPFRPLTREEDEAVIQEIERSGVRILFVGLGCPKQERWIGTHRDVIPAVMVGVGAAFDFHAGVIPQAPSWMQRNGLEWLFRLIIEPRRLWRRYFLYNPRFLYLAIKDLIAFHLQD